MTFSFSSTNEKDEVRKSWEYHLGKLSLVAMKNNSHRIQQIDVFNDTIETHGSIRLRSIRVAQALTKKKIGLNDVILLCGPNHMDICLPLLASLYIGASIMPLAENQTLSEWCHWLNLTKPKIIFCQDVQAETVQDAVKRLNFNIEIVVFGKCDLNKFTAFSEFLKSTGTENSFSASDFDPFITTAIIICTSGTTGHPKAVCLLHAQLVSSINFYKRDILKKYHKDEFEDLSLCPSSIHWITGIISALHSITNGSSRLICPVPFTSELINKSISQYKPTLGIGISNILSPSNVKNVDTSCFKFFFISGGVIPTKVLKDLMSLSPNAKLINIYGSTECCGSLSMGLIDSDKNNACGKLFPWIQWKIVDSMTLAKLQPYECGELWLRGPTCFYKYFNDDESTKNATTKDGWYKTGDIMYYDENEIMYFIDKEKEILKYKGHQISPVEIEIIICQFKGVRCCCVIGRKSEHGDLPMAFVEIIKGSKVSVDDVKNIVKESLAEWKQIRGEVVFLESLPMTSSGKMNRKLLKEMVVKMDS